MTLTYWLIASNFFLLLLVVIYRGNALHWKATAETLDAERSDTGWEEEARFWRRHFDKDAAEYIDSLG